MEGLILKTEKNVGIVSLYYNSKNYGGLLQAYALSRFIDSLGYDSELISYNRVERKPLYLPPQKSKLYKLVHMPVSEITWRVYAKVLRKIKENQYISQLKTREDAVASFREGMIKHSPEYTERTISECEKNYDILVSGSDQIWKPGVVDDGFVFNFIPVGSTKRVVSYASSVSVNNLPVVYIDYMKKALSKYAAVSVREKKTAEQFRADIYENTEAVLDPTLLIDRDEWYSLAGKRMINEKYIFCYMLGDNRKQRKQIIKFAKKHNLKLVTIPHIVNSSIFTFRAEDFHFGDTQLYKVGIPDFLALIRDAEIVITDSFHAGVFSYVFHKEFFLLERPTNNPEDVMNVRIYDLVDLFGVPERVVPIDDELLHKVCQVKDIDYSQVDKRVLDKREESRRYLISALSN